MLVALDAVSGTRCMLSNVVSAKKNKKRFATTWEARSKAVKSSVCVRRKLSSVENMSIKTHTACAIKHIPHHKFEFNKKIDATSMRVC